MTKPGVSRRGIYYNLEISPYSFTTPCGDIFKFSSPKKLEIYVRRLNELNRKRDKIVNEYEEILGIFWKENTLIKLEEEIYVYVYNEVLT